MFAFPLNRKAFLQALDVLQPHSEQHLPRSLRQTPRKVLSTGVTEARFAGCFLNRTAMSRFTISFVLAQLDLGAMLAFLATPGISLMLARLQKRFLHFDSVDTAMIL